MNMQKSKPPKNAKLVQARTKKLWTQEQAAKKSDVSLTTYQRWELGQQRPGLVNLERLCQAFDKTPEELGYGYLTIADTTPPPSPEETNNDAQNVSSSAQGQPTPSPTSSTNDLEQTHEQLIALAKALFKNHPLRINKFQDVQHTLHVFCDSQIDKDTITSIKREFRHQSNGWVIGIERQF